MLLITKTSCKYEKVQNVAEFKSDSTECFYVKMDTEVNQILIQYKHDIEKQEGVNFFKDHLIQLQISSAYSLISLIQISWTCHPINRIIEPPDYYTVIELVPVLINFDGNSLIYHDKQAIIKELTMKYPQYAQQERGAPATCKPEIWRFFICNESKEVFSLTKGDYKFMDITKALERCIDDNIN